MSAREHVVEVPGGTIHALLWEAEGPTLVFAHATGMCAAVYRDLLAPLQGTFRIVAFDARGHGRTSLPADPAQVPADWRVYQEDLVHLARAVARGPLFLAGHSFGATTAFEAATANRGLAEAVLLLDPAFIPFAQAQAYRAARDGQGTPMNPMAEQAARRRSVFESVAAARAGWQGRGVFQGWPPSALEAYLEGGLVAEEGGGVRLACSPAWEATSFRGVSTRLEEAMRSPDAPPFMLLAGDIGSTVSPEDEATIRALHPQAPVTRFAGVGHFFPVTHAALVRPWFEALPGLSRRPGPGR
ncbi:alpha/beta fold hydrolase [Thermaurantiacus sp.]